MDCIPEHISYKKCDCRINLKHEKPLGRGKCKKININDDGFNKNILKKYMNNSLLSLFFLDQPDKY